MLNFRNSLVHRDSAAGHQQLPAGQHPDDQLTAAQLHMDILPGGADAQLGQGRHGGAGAGAAGPGLAAAALMRITSSILSSAFRRPSKIWALSCALLRSYCVLLRTTFS